VAPDYALARQKGLEAITYSVGFGESESALTLRGVGQKQHGDVEQVLRSLRSEL